MCRYHACATPVCLLVIVAGMAELLFAGLSLHSVWLPHVALNITGGVLSVVCGLGHLVALRVRHGRCEACCLRVVLVTASLVQLTALLLLVADKVGSVGFAVHKLGIKAAIDQHEAMKTFGSAQNDTDVRILLILNILCTLLTCVQCACVCRPTPSYKSLDLHSIIAKAPGAWVYNAGTPSDESRLMLDRSDASTPGTDTSVIRTETETLTRNVTLMSYKPLASHESPDGCHMEFVPLKDLKSQTIDEYCSQYSIGRVAKEPMQSFRANISPDSDCKSRIKLLNTSVSPRHSFSLPPLISKPNRISVMEDNPVTSDEEISNSQRYSDLPDGHFGNISPVTAASPVTAEDSPRSSWNDESWTTVSASVKHYSLVSVAEVNAEEGVAEGCVSVEGVSLASDRNERWI